MHKNTLIVLLFLALNSFGQKPFSEKFETDSSSVEIIRNSIYKCWDETYKFKDSTRFISWFIDDTTQISYESWGRKSSNTYLGISREYKKDGTLMYEWDHDKGICRVNRELYPYHDMLEEMKIKADSLIIKNYSKDFYDTHVRFEYDCSAYHGHYEKLTTSEDTYWSEDYLGSWTEPMKSKPNSFLLRYQVRLDKEDIEGIELGIELDSLGHYIPSGDDTWNNYGFEDVRGDKKTFQINRKSAIVKAIEQGLMQADSSKIAEFLTWENFKKKTLYDGQFRYYITELTGTTEYKEGADRQGIIYHFNVYSFNPWTGEFIEKKKMKRRHEWGKDSGHWTSLRPDND
jgi:hypothetical protein